MDKPLDETDTALSEELGMGDTLLAKAFGGEEASATNKRGA
jgi:hypothetical protein